MLRAAGGGRTVFCPAKLCWRSQTQNSQRRIPRPVSNGRQRARHCLHSNGQNAIRGIDAGSTAIAQNLAAIFMEKVMNSKKLVFLAMGLALLTAPLSSAPANAKHRGRHAHPHRQVAARHYKLQRRALDGVLVDRNGWRQTASWDNSCHNLLHLHSMYACSAHGG